MTDARAELRERVARDRYEEKRARLLEAFGDTTGWPEWVSLKQTLKDIEIETYAPVIDLVLEEAARVAESKQQFYIDPDTAEIHESPITGIIATAIRARKSGK